jgi:quercetin dioxygenase-like cupin family protein
MSRDIEGQATDEAKGRLPPEPVMDGRDQQSPGAGDEMTDKPMVMTPQDRPSPLDVFATDVTVLAAASRLGCYGITHQQGAEGTGPPPHRHDWDEAFYVLTGEITFRCGDDTYACPPGTLVHVPRNTVHAFTYGPGGGSMIELTSRDSRSAETFTDVDAEIESTNPDFPKAIEVLRRNGVNVAP